jgi:hypothetical protein
VPADSGENLERQMLLSLFLVGPYACFFNCSKTSEGQFFCQEKLHWTIPGKDIASRQIQYMQARRHDFF